MPEAAELEGSEVLEIGDLDLARQGQPARDPRPLLGEQNERLPGQRLQEF